MHEFSIATDVAEAVSDFAAENPDKIILKVHLRIGELTCVESEPLIFCYNSITRETRLENSTLEIEIVPAKVKCPHCNYQGAPMHWKDALTVLVPTLQCPDCGRAVQAIAGHECTIKSIQFRKRDPALANKGGTAISS